MAKNTGPRFPQPAEKRCVRLHLGCGACTPVGWVNIDGSWNARLAKYPTIRSLLGSLRIVPQTLTRVPWDSSVLYHDLRRPLPFPDQSAEAIYASHLLEHMYFNEAQSLLKECFRVLKTGSVLRLVVPDLRSILEEYHGGTPFVGENDVPTFELRGDRVNERLGLRRVSAPNGSLPMRIYKAMTDFDVHKWMYDAESLVHYVQMAGFEDVSEMKFQQSRIANIAEIEHSGRVLHGAGICVEGVKPKA